MKLYFTPGTCSFAPHLAIRELGLDVELSRVRIGADPVVVADGRDFRQINPLGYVPVLELDDGRVLTEGSAMLLHLADAHPEGGLAPPAGTAERDELHRWLVFIGTELHKTFSPWLFHPEYGEQAAQVARERLFKRLAVVERHLEGRQYLLGERFGIADAYLFTVVDWVRPLKIALDDYPNIAAYLERVRARPAVAEALRREKTP
ncbi:glutathione S-transferase family protein [Lysobacter sp. BMK333-48F3]|uniref:glutathione binding-like protein n=1 Tax=Lysobacter sp. BMK333-48F3 TaxID=2867962 RepID=UPI001C8BDFAF|nr:glutathione binding-like protein [Lysobacter sp. BMK333-48F3]MBX9401489.1 glutathione S-transferase family protein [Lysobacter sp. BMK333-48F3]